MSAWHATCDLKARGSHEYACGHFRPQPSCRQFSLLLLLLLLLLAGAGVYWWYASPTAALSGQVVDSDARRQPVSGAEISVVGTARPVRRLARPLPLEVSAGGRRSGESRCTRLRRRHFAAQMNRGAETRLDIPLASTQIDGRPASLVRRQAASRGGVIASLDMGMSVAATNDKHVVLGTANPPGVYRFACNDQSADPERCLSSFGAVAADIHSARWAARSRPIRFASTKVRRMVKQLALPKGMVHYGNGLMSFSNDDGWLCVACVEKDHPDDGVWLCLCSKCRKGLFRAIIPMDGASGRPRICRTCPSRTRKSTRLSLVRGCRGPAPLSLAERRLRSLSGKNVSLVSNNLSNQCSSPLQNLSQPEHHVVHIALKSVARPHDFQPRLIVVQGRIRGRRGGAATG